MRVSLFRLLKAKKKILKAQATCSLIFCKALLLSLKNLELIRQREIDDCEEVKSDPQRLCLQELERLKNPWPRDSIHYVPSYERESLNLKALSLPRIKQAYENSVGCQSLCLALVGDTDEQMPENFSKIFGDASNKPAYERISRPFLKNLIEERSFNTPDKEMAVIAMATNFAMRDDHPDYAALKLAKLYFWRGREFPSYESDTEKKKVFLMAQARG